MAAAGLNIFPSVDSSKYVSIQEKVGRRSTRYTKILYAGSNWLNIP